MRPPLRFLTCGSVDDGKSTLIGRLLHDAAVLPEDQIAALAEDGRHRGGAAGGLDFARLLDGLEAEREQGITIDIAWRSFVTPRRAFIVADAPGHEQYTRNMASAASVCAAAVLLVDARRGLLPQTRRHAQICALMGIRDIVLAVNKMDLVGHDPAVFTGIADAFAALAAPLGLPSLTAIPLCAVSGGNVAAADAAMPWYAGPTLLDHLSVLDAGDDAAARAFRFPVQWVNRLDAEQRGLAGTITSGAIAVGDRVVDAVSGAGARIARIVTADGDLARAEAGAAVTLVPDAAIDIARGDLLVPAEARPLVAHHFAAHLLWCDAKPLLPQRGYLLRTGTRWTRAAVTAIRHRLDAENFTERPARILALNDIGFCHVETAERIAFDAFAEDPATGGFILVDAETGRSVGAGMIRHALRRADNIHPEPVLVNKAARAARLGQAPRLLWFTGLSGAGKSTIARRVEQLLHEAGRATYWLDGDNIRHGLSRDLGFTDADRVENIRRIGEVAKLMVDAGLIVLASFISPFAAERRMVRDMLAPGEFLEIFVDAPIELCIRRDPKGLYAKALAGGLPNFTGISSPYETPATPDIRIATEALTPEQAAHAVLAALQQHEAS